MEMSVVWRRTIPQILVAIILVVMTALYFLYVDKTTKSALNYWDGLLINYSIVIAALAAIVGGVDLARYHVSLIMKREREQIPFSLITLILEVVCVIFAFYAIATGVPILTQPQFSWIYLNLQVPTSSAMYSILVFYVASAAYRTFRARNPPALLLLVVGVIVMLGNTSLGFVIWPGFTPLKDWIMTVPNAAGYRPIVIGVGLGTIILGLRLILRKEVTWMGRRD
ncbi:MAG: hypothetical protein QW486_02905 [Candidatus Bathyarchaeia archaeon]